MVRLPFVLLLLCTAPAADAAVSLTGAVPFDTLTACVRDRLAPSGRVTAINTAAGALLDYAFDTVALDGRVAPARLQFTIEDHGTERTLSVAAPVAADESLAQQYLRQVGGRCLAAGAARVPAAHGAP